MPPPSPWSHTRNASVADDIDFDIKGQELQFVEIELDPGESAIAEAGATSIKDMGKVMAALKARHAGRMDFSKASGATRALLGG